MARYLVGIDLGTTNSALAYIDLQKGRAGQPEIHKFPVPQLVAPGEVGTRPLLPSFLYLPGPHDLPPGAAALPWDPAAGAIVGEFARNHGARALPGEAARKAGLENLTLLEEPQAAFYCWLATHPPKEAAQLKPGYRCLVVDVGGGTSDFSLIQAVEQQGELGFVRLAVGDHLLLGGDNMDLALAKFVEAKLPQAGRLDAAQYGMLTQACRQAKESLLGPDAPASYTVTVMGRGRQVVGGAQHTAITPEDVRRILFDGFFPVVPQDAEPARG